jgi:hypothetical protein
MTLRILCLVDAEALNASYHLSCEKKLAGKDRILASSIRPLRPISLIFDSRGRASMQHRQAKIDVKAGGVFPDRLLLPNLARL